MIIKTICSAALLVSLTAFAQNNNSNMNNNCCKPASCCNMEMDDGLPCCDMGTYNKSASYTMDRCDCAQNMFFVDASFIYWNVSQQYMDYGRSVLTGSGLGGTPATAVANAQIALPDFKYKPGFKVGIGIDTAFDGWVVAAEYTWLHQKTSTSVGTIVTPAVPGVTHGWLPNDWFNALDNATQRTAETISSNWKMNMDLLDVTVGRPYWNGRQLSIFPSAGLRALWIRQAYTLAAVGPASISSTALGLPVESHNRSQCWSIGPTMSMASHWLFGAGFRFEGDMGFSLLYTRYTKLSHSEDDQFGTTGIASINGHMDPFGCLRPTADFGLGLGWGTYFCNKDYHVDIVARYDFNIFWDQNMMRTTVAALANNLVGYSDPSGDLYMHGLTVTARFDF